MKRILLVIATMLVMMAQGGQQIAKIILSSSSGYVEVIPSPGPGRNIKLWHIMLSLAAATNIKYGYGTGTNCGTGTTDLTGTFGSVQALADDIPQLSRLQIPSNVAFCISFADSSTGGGYVIYSAE